MTMKTELLLKIGERACIVFWHFVGGQCQICGREECITGGRAGELLMVLSRVEQRFVDAAELVSISKRMFGNVDVLRTMHRSITSHYFKFLSEGI